VTVTHPLSKFAACAICARLYWLWTADPASADGRLAYVGHVVAAHPKLVPPAAPGCEMCIRYRGALELPSTILAPTIRDMLRRINAEHRVDAHLLALPAAERRAA